MKSVWKFPISDKCEIDIPVGSALLHVGSQGGRVVLWAGVDPAVLLVARRFRVIATGQPFNPNGLHYIGTTLIPEHDEVWHVFEEV